MTGRGQTGPGVRFGLAWLAIVLLAAAAGPAAAQEEFDGSYVGTLSGDDSGSLELTISSGQVSGTVTTSGSGSFPVSGSLDGNGIFFGGGSEKYFFGGSFVGTDRFIGDWSCCSSSLSGTFAGQRAAEVVQKVVEVTEAQAVTAINTTGQQRNNFYRRMETIRSSGGTGGLNLEGIAINFRGVTITSDMLMSGETGLAELATALGTAFDSGSAPWARRGRQAMGGNGGWDRQVGPAQRMAPSAQAMAQETEPGAGPATDVVGASLIPDYGVFLNGVVSFTDRETTLTELGFDATTFGFSSGVDRRFGDKVVAGGGLGYTRDTTNLTGGGQSTSNAVYAVFYSTMTPLEDFYVDAVLSVGWIGYDIERAVSPLVIATGETNGAQLWGGITGGYIFHQKGASLSPYFRLNGGSTWIGEYTDSVAGIPALQWASNTIWSFSTVLALRLDYTFSTRYGVVVPYVRGEYEHEFGDTPSNDIRPVTGLFGTGTTVRGSGIDRNFFNVGGGVSMTFPRAWAGFVDYDGLFGADHLTRHTLTAGIRKEF